MGLPEEGAQCVRPGDRREGGSCIRAWGLAPLLNGCVALDKSLNTSGLDLSSKVGAEFFLLTPMLSTGLSICKVVVQPMFIDQA